MTDEKMKVYTEKEVSHIITNEKIAAFQQGYNKGFSEGFLNGSLRQHYETLTSCIRVLTDLQFVESGETDEMQGEDENDETLKE
jgi:hypothetical protein